MEDKEHKQVVEETPSNDSDFIPEVELDEEGKPKPKPYIQKPWVSGSDYQG